MLEKHFFSLMRAEQALTRKESQDMNVASGFHLQEARQAMLDESLLKRGVLLRLGLGWFGEVVTRRAQGASHRAYDCSDGGGPEHPQCEAPVGSAQHR